MTIWCWPVPWRQEAAYLVTRDKDLLVLQQYAGVAIVTPEAFLTWLRSNPALKERNAMASTTLAVPRPAAQALTPAQFQTLAEVPRRSNGLPTSPTPTRAAPTGRTSTTSWPSQACGSPEQFRDVTRAHVIAWREQLAGKGLANDTIRRKLAALSSLYAYLCDRNAVLHNPVLGVKRPRSMNRGRGDAGARRSPGADAAGGPTGGHAQGQAGPGHPGHTPLSWPALRGVVGSVLKVEITA